MYKLMKKRLWVLVCLVAGMLTSCLNDDYADQNAADQELIRAYIDAKGLDLEYDPISGIHYRIISIGDTTYRPSADSSDILVNYEGRLLRSEEHTSELQSLMRISYAVFCLNKKTS